MRDSEQSIDQYGFNELAPAGYYLAVRVGFAFPEHEFNALPRGWVHHYTRGGLMLHDPVMRWIYENSGAIRWSNIKIPDEMGVLIHAAEYGLVHGAAVCVSGDHTNGLRTFGTFARSEREYQDDEIDTLNRLVNQVHSDFSPPDDLTNAELDALGLMREGMLVKEAAFRLGISEGAVKQRLRTAKSKLKARTTAQAVSTAARFGLI